MSKQTKQVFWTPISTTVREVEVSGEYYLDGDGFITVRLPGVGSRSARGGPAAESIARIVLGELYRESRHT
jgi:hypothetical protein